MALSLILQLLWLATKYGAWKAIAVAVIRMMMCLRDCNEVLYRLSPIGFVCFVIWKILFVCFVSPYSRHTYTIRQLSEKFSVLVHHYFKNDQKSPNCQEITFIICMFIQHTNLQPLRHFSRLRTSPSMPSCTSNFVAADIFVAATNEILV